MRNLQKPRAFPWAVLPACLLLAGAMLAVAPAARAQDAGEEWRVDPLRGPVDLGLTDPSLIGAIDVHLHVDPDAPGTGGVIRAIDVFEAAKIAMARGMRGFVFKTHQDPISAAGAYMVRKHVSPTLEIFGRMASNYSTGGVNVAALEHLLAGGQSRALNLANRTGYSVMEVVRAVESVCGLAVPLHTAARREGDAPVLVGDGRRARTLLGWLPRRSDLETQIRDAWRWMTTVNARVNPLGLDSSSGLKRRFG